MLSDTSKLFFPKIVFNNSNEIILNETPKILNFYNLDWTRKMNKCSNGEQELLPEYESLLSSLRFAISDGYLKEIRRVSRCAVSEWNQLRLLDSSLKHIYLEPAASYVECGLKLLSDCIFDTTTNYYYRGPYKHIIPYLLLYKFWKNQTNKNLMMLFTHTSDLITLSMNENINEESQIKINEFMNYMNDELE